MIQSAICEQLPHISLPEVAVTALNLPQFFAHQQIPFAIIVNSAAPERGVKNDIACAFSRTDDRQKTIRKVNGVTHSPLTFVI